MTRIVYIMLASEKLTGGQKMILRHVEALRGLGFDAACTVTMGAKPPSGLQHEARIIDAADVRPDDVLVVPDDANHVLERALAHPNRLVVFAQGGFALAAIGAAILDRYPTERFPAFIAVSDALAGRVRRLYPAADVRVVPCFADERLFRPGPKDLAIACSLHKRRFEAAAIRTFYQRLRPDTGWRFMGGASEVEVAETLAGSAIYLSLNRLESVGIATLEAMASGCVCAGFLGQGGEIYGAPENGFWVRDDDCEAAAEALVSATEVAAGGGPPLQRMVEAARATAAQWSYARFRGALEAVWEQLAPDARTLATS